MSEDPRDAPEALLQFEQDTILLVMGPKQKKLLLYRSHIESSRFLTAAFKEEWARGAKELELPKDDVDDVRDYLRSLYTSKIASKADDEDATIEEHNTELMLLARLFVLNETYQHVHLKNKVIDAFIAKNHASGWSPTCPEVNRKYRGSRAGSPICKLMVDMHLKVGHGEWVSKGEPHNPKFLQDRCAAALELRYEQRM